MRLSSIPNINESREVKPNFNVNNSQKKMQKKEVALEYKGGPFRNRNFCNSQGFIYFILFWAETAVGCAALPRSLVSLCVLSPSLKAPMCISFSC